MNIRAQKHKRLLASIVILTMLFSAFSGIIVVYAAPGVTSIRYERVRENTAFGPTENNRLIIYGNEFSEPKVKAGMVSEIPLPINEGLSNEDMIVIDDQEALDLIEGIPNKILVLNEGTVDISGGGIDFDLTSIPTVSSTSTSKVYKDDPLVIGGFGFNSLSIVNDTLSISGTSYLLNDGTANIENDSTIRVPNVKAPLNTGLSSVGITRKLGGDPKYQIVSILKNSIRVVSEIQGIEIERIDPNSGPKNKNNIISIYGKPGLANFNSSMRVFIDEPAIADIEAVNKGTIMDDQGNVIGLKVELPTRSLAGSVDLLLTTPDMGSEFSIPNAFVYLDLGNYLSIDEPGGISPTYKKETEYKPVTIKGRNIGYFYEGAYDKISNVTTPPDTLIKYASYLSFTDPASYKVKYNAIYNGSVPVTIIREIQVFIDQPAEILDSPVPTFTRDKDTITVLPKDVTTNEDKKVNVIIQTTTTVFDETNPLDLKVYYNRNEEYIVTDGFTYIPNELAPSITAVTPEYGPKDREIYMTIFGTQFQVLEDGSLPSVRIGGRTITDIKVYDDRNRLVDGKVIALGNKIKLKMTPPTPVEASLDGAVDVVVTNPSGGQATLVNGFEFRNPDAISRPAEKMPVMSEIKLPIADIRGGVESGETVKITGANFDTSADTNHRVIITIDGEYAEIEGKVSSDGKNVTIIPPPGTVPGMTKLQLINEDGSMASEDFEYRLVTSAPKITQIVPDRGGKGTKLVIKGEDFLMPDLSVPPDDPRRKGSVVLLNGIELNAYNYLPAGTVTEVGGSIYFNGTYDPDGAGSEPAYLLNGEMVKVQDITTIYVDVPDKFYSFLAGSAPYLTHTNVPLGDLTVEVLNPDGAKTKENFEFKYMNPATIPTIDSVNGVVPSSGSINGGTIVTIKGTNFKQNNIKVYFGSEQSENIQFINATEIRALVPVYPYPLPEDTDQLAVPVMVMNYDGGAAVKDNGFTYRIPGSNPVIESLSPNKGSAAGNEEVVIRGTDFRRSPDGSVLPKVYFNGKEAQVTWYGNSNVSEILTVVTPPSTESGPVDVVIVNFDSGSYTFKSFTYEKSSPNITGLTPDKISKLGNVKMQINGTNFKKSDFTSLTNNPLELVNRHTSTPVAASTVIDTLVVFGDNTTGDVKSIDTVIGPFETVMDNLKIEYRTEAAGVAKVKIVKASDGAVVKQETDIEVGSSHLFIVNGPQDLGDTTIADEGILVEVTPNQVIVTRRIAPYAKWENNGLQLTVKSPPVNIIGTRKVYVINSDKGTASFNVNITNPASNPQITYISPRNKVKRDSGIIDYTTENKNLDKEYYSYVPIDGGTFITINGSDFRKNVKVYIDNKPAEILSRSINEDQLVIKVPKGTEADTDRLYRVVVVNEDGGSTDSTSMPKPHYVVYKKPSSTPIIEKVLPDMTSARGQNTVKITGDDFRSGIKVFIDGVESPQVIVVNYRELSVRIPANLTFGKKVVQVMNTDYGFYEKKDALTIISSPEINEVYDYRGYKMSDIVFSIEGGQTIKLLGKDFVEGAEVIVGGIMKPESELAEGETGIECYNINDTPMVIVGGQKATDVEVEGSTMLTFKTPAAKVGDTSIIVLNKDGGVSNVISGSYQKPYPDSPSGLTVEVVDADTLKIEWDKIEETKYYEVYVSISKNGDPNSSYKYLGSIVPYAVTDTRLRSYIDGLEAGTWYSIRLKSVNSYGASKFSAASKYIRTSEIKTGLSYQDIVNAEKQYEENDDIQIGGNMLNYVVGEKSIGNYGTGLVVYFDEPSYSSLNPKSVEINFELIKKYPNNDIRINEKGIKITMLANNLMVEEMYEVDTTKHSDSKISLTLNKQLGSKGDEIRLRVPAGYKLITDPFRIKLEMQVEKEKTEILSFNGAIELLLSYSEDKKKLYPGGIYVAFYNSASKTMEILTTTEAESASQSSVTRTGEYMLVGKMKK
ncbi:MAG: IPT/TIG domain-containing protein [Bacillota bacterium]